MNMTSTNWAVVSSSIEENFFKDNGEFKVLRIHNSRAWMLMDRIDLGANEFLNVLRFSSKDFINRRFEDFNYCCE